MTLHPQASWSNGHQPSWQRQSMYSTSPRCMLQSANARLRLRYRNDPNGKQRNFRESRAEQSRLQRISRAFAKANITPRMGGGAERGKHCGVRGGQGDGSSVPGTGGRAGSGSRSRRRREDRRMGKHAPPEEAGLGKERRRRRRGGEARRGGAYAYACKCDGAGRLIWRRRGE
jgi:hypothetical protein